MKLSVYGTGCAKCKQLYQAADKASKELGISCEIEKVEDIQKIMSAGIMGTPALSVNDKIVVSGRVPSDEEMKKLLSGKE